VLIGDEADANETGCWGNRFGGSDVILLPLLRVGIKLNPEFDVDADVIVVEVADRKCEADEVSGPEVEEAASIPPIIPMFG
jgi:hypothetical protein